jgi:hypothetical protein
MIRFISGVMVGMALSGTVALAGSLYDSKGNPAGPRGSIQQLDYFRNRQQQLDVQHLRRQADRQRLEHRVNPCAK